MPTPNDLVERWRALGPVLWASSPYGWIGEDGAPIVLEPWQAAALQAWWTNRQTVTTLALSNVKKTGKTLANAVITCWRWLALPGEHFAAANDLDQSAGRQFSAIADMCRRNPYLKNNVELGKTRLVFTPTGSTLTALASDAAGNAGANHLTASHTEAWGVSYEASVRSWEELSPPPGLFYGLPALRIADSYAGYLGESKTWHALVDRGLKGTRLPGAWPIYLADGLLLFHMEGEDARARCFRGTPAQADAYYAEQQRELRPHVYARMHDNTRTEAEGQFITRDQWQACEITTLPYAGELVLGADASTSNDLTALVGCSFDEASGRVVVPLVRVWKPQRGLLRLGRPTVDIEATLEAEVLALHKAGRVRAVVLDPYQLHTSLIRFEKAGIRVIELAQNAGRIEADQALYQAVINHTLGHTGDPVLTEHALASVAIETPRGFRLAKEKASKKIDAMVALSMAHYGAQQHFVAVGPTVSMPNIFMGDYDGFFDAGLSLYLPKGARDYTWVVKGTDENRHEQTQAAADACKFRQRGCASCLDYFQPQVEAERRSLKDVIPMTEEEYDREFYGPLLERQRMAALHDGSVMSEGDRLAAELGRKIKGVMRP